MWLSTSINSQKQALHRDRPHFLYFMLTTCSPAPYCHKEAMLLPVYFTHAMRFYTSIIIWSGSMQKHLRAPGFVTTHYFVWVFFYVPYTIFYSVIHSLLHASPQWEAADAETRVPAVENTKKGNTGLYVHRKPLRLIRDGEVEGSGFLYLTPTRYTVPTRMILH